MNIHGDSSRPRNTEPSVNVALANALKRLHPDWNDDTLHAERTNVIQSVSESHSAVQKSTPKLTGKRPDILVAPPRRQPVIVETEFHPARTVEQEAIARLGLPLKGSGEDIEGVLSVILPESLKHGNLDEVANVTFQYATHYLDRDGEISRWPGENDWLEGKVEDLADAIEFVSISPKRIATSTTILEVVVSQSAERLIEWAGEDALKKIATKLHQEPGTQTIRMVTAIFVSAFVFHAAIEEQLQIPQIPRDVSISKFELLSLWEEILEVNYWPVFGIAKELLEELPVIAVPRVMDRIARSISSLAQLGAMSYHDLTGRMFQTLITDRKFLATFYTLPESACLLAELAVNRLDVDWSDKTAIEQLKIADFACGTGALLSAVQRSICRKYRRTGGDDMELHSVMMENVLIGLDIMPAATHLTCSILSSFYPSLAYGECQIHTMPYGIEEDGTHIGSLDFLTEDYSYSLFASGETLTGTKTNHTQGYSVTLKVGSCDLVIMNPPFTRPTGHEGAIKTDTPVPSFAGLGKGEVDQRAMSAKLKKSQPEFGHGNAGLASNFMDLGHRKLKDGGILALVLPFAAVQGKAWGKARKMLNDHYDDIHIVSIATTGGKDQAFSADTGMAEVLVVAKKQRSSKKSIYCSNLRSRPVSFLDAAEEAKRQPQEVLSGNILEAGFVGVLSNSVIKSAQNILQGKLVLPRSTDQFLIPIIALGDIALRGLYSLDINGEPPRGAFKNRKLEENEVPEYPALWNHDANRERMMVVQPDSSCDVNTGYEQKAVDDWKRTASRLHWNADFRLNSQSLSMCITLDECIGGTAWPNVIVNDNRHEIVLLLWSNSTLGLLMHWWKGTRQQQGRSRVSITAMSGFPVLDATTLTSEQLDLCQSIFNELKNETFLPANESYRDNIRKQLDRALLCDVLCFPVSVIESLDLLRDQWCAEPSVHGGKKTRINTGYLD